MEGPIEAQRGIAHSFFRSMADETRLRLLGALAGREQSLEELAARAEHKPSAVAQELVRLQQKGLVGTTADGRYKLDMERMRFYCRELLAPAKAASELGAGAPSDAAERRVLENFLGPDGRLKEIPATPKKRLVVLRYLLAKFEPGAEYPEPKVNELLGHYHPDVAALRRYLVDEGMMRRQAGVYQRVS